MGDSLYKELQDLERREFIRLDLTENPLPVRIFSEDDEEGKEAGILNLSERGISIQSFQVLPVRKKIRFTISLPGGGSVEGIGRILHGYYAVKSYYYGISIQNYSGDKTPDLLLQFIYKNVNEKGTIDRRKGQRRRAGKNVETDARKWSTRRLKKSIFRKCVTNARYEELAKMDVYLREIENYKGSKIRIAGKELISYTDCSYLGLNDHPKIREAMIAAINEYGTNCSSSRLLGGNTRLHTELEERLARFTGTQACIVYTLGYMANLGCISDLVGPDEYILLDLKAHASLIDASMLSRGKIIPFRHDRLESLEKTLERVRGKALIVTDGVFSMHGDIAPIDRLHELAAKYDAGLMVDDAHGLFILGENGRGTSELFGLDGRIDLTMGTMSKSIPLLGGFIVANKVIVKHLLASSRPFIFTLALPPHIVAGAIAALDIIEREPGLRKELFKRVSFMNGKLVSEGFPKHDSVTPIIPVPIGDDEMAYRVMKALEAKGIFVDAVTYPAVKANEALLRFIVTLKHSCEELEYTVTELGKACRQMGCAP
jgi:8-amino-7-oxononanoate synthase